MSYLFYKNTNRLYSTTIAVACSVAQHTENSAREKPHLHPHITPPYTSQTSLQHYSNQNFSLMLCFFSHRKVCDTRIIHHLIQQSNHLRALKLTSYITPDDLERACHLRCRISYSLPRPTNNIYHRYAQSLRASITTKAGVRALLLPRGRNVIRTYFQLRHPPR